MWYYISCSTLMKTLILARLSYRLIVGLQPTVIASRAPHLLLEQSVRFKESWTCIARQQVERAVMVTFLLKVKCRLNLPDVVWPAALLNQFSPSRGSLPREPQDYAGLTTGLTTCCREVATLVSRWGRPGGLPLRGSRA